MCSLLVVVRLRAGHPSPPSVLLVVAMVMVLSPEDLRMGSLHKDVAALMVAAAEERTDQEVRDSHHWEGKDG